MQVYVPATTDQNMEVIFGTATDVFAAAATDALAIGFTTIGAGTKKGASDSDVLGTNDGTEDTDVSDRKDGTSDSDVLLGISLGTGDMDSVTPPSANADGARELDGEFVGVDMAIGKPNGVPLLTDATIGAAEGTRVAEPTGAKVSFPLVTLGDIVGELIDSSMDINTNLS
jgi:hypothetical protein